MRVLDSLRDWRQCRGRFELVDKIITNDFVNPIGPSLTTRNGWNKRTHWTHIAFGSNGQLNQDQSYIYIYSLGYPFSQLLFPFSILFQRFWNYINDAWTAGWTKLWLELRDIKHIRGSTEEIDGIPFMMIRVQRNLHKSWFQLLLLWFL